MGQVCCCEVCNEMAARSDQRFQLIIPDPGDFWGVVDRWIGKQPEALSKSEAVRRLVLLGAAGAKKLEGVSPAVEPVAGGGGSFADETARVAGEALARSAFMVSKEPPPPVTVRSRMDELVPFNPPRFPLPKGQKRR